MKKIKIHSFILIIFFQTVSLFSLNNPVEKKVSLTEDQVSTPVNHSEASYLIKEIMDLQKQHLQELKALKDSHKEEIILLKKSIQAVEYNATFSDLNLQKKLSEIKLPELAFSNAPLPEVMMEIVRQSRMFDVKEKEILKKGVNIITKQNNIEPFPRLSFTLNSMELGRSLQYLTEMINWKYEIKNGAVYVQKFSELPFNEFLETGIYQLDQKTINRLISLGGTRNNPDSATGLAIKSCFERHGVVFDHERGHQFVFDGFQVVIKSEKIYLDAIESIIERLKRFP